MLDLESLKVLDSDQQYHPFDYELETVGCSVADERPSSPYSHRYQPIVAAVPSFKSLQVGGVRSKAGLFLAPCGLGSPGDFTSSEHFEGCGDPSFFRVLSNQRGNGLPLLQDTRGRSTAAMVARRLKAVSAISS